MKEVKELILIIELIIIRAKVLQNNLIIYNDIKNGRISLQKEENIQEEFSSKLNEILKGNLNYKSKDQINTIKNIKKFYDGPGKVLNFFNGHTRMVLVAKYKSIHGEGLKILTPKQMLQRLPIALAQIKAGNASENLLNELENLYILCIEQKKLLKKYTTM